MSIVGMEERLSEAGEAGGELELCSLRLVTDISWLTNTDSRLSRELQLLYS